MRGACVAGIVAGDGELDPPDYFLHILNFMRFARVNVCGNWKLHVFFLS